MSKRFSIIAAALVSSGRCLSTTVIDRSGAQLLELQTKPIDDLSVEERSRIAFADPEEWPLRNEGVNSVVPRAFLLAL